MDFFIHVASWSLSKIVLLYTTLPGSSCLWELVSQHPDFFFFLWNRLNTLLLKWQGKEMKDLNRDACRIMSLIFQEVPARILLIYQGNTNMCRLLNPPSSSFSYIYSHKCLFFNKLIF